MGERILGLGKEAVREAAVRVEGFCMKSWAGRLR
jgi:hypothetical protein